MRHLSTADAACIIGSTACVADPVDIGWPEDEVRPRISFHTTNPVVAAGDSLRLEIHVTNAPTTFEITTVSGDTSVATVMETFVKGIRPGETILRTGIVGTSARDSTTVRVVP